MFISGFRAMEDNKSNQMENNKSNQMEVYCPPTDDMEVQSTSSLEVYGRRVRRKTTRTTVVDEEIEIIGGKKGKMSMKTFEVEDVKEEMDLDEGDIKLASRTSPSGLVSMIPHLSPDKLEAIRQMGFGHVLECKISSIPMNLGKWLLDNFDPFNSTLALPSGEKIKIEERDVYLTLGLPMGTEMVVEAADTRERENVVDPEYSATLAEFRRYWGLARGFPVVTKMPTKMIEDQDYGDIFKRNFIVFYVSTFISGSQNRSANLIILKSLVHTQSVSNLNWCAYTLKNLIESVIYWRERAKRSFFTGPLFFLMMFYLDRVVFKWRMVSRFFPTYSSWTQAEIKKRVEDELKHGGFGRGSVEAALVVKEKREEKRVVVKVDNSEDKEKDEDVCLNKDLFSNIMKSAGMQKFSASNEEEMIKIVTSICKKLIAVLTEFTSVIGFLSAQHPNSRSVRKIIEGLVRMVVGLRDKVLKNSIGDDEGMPSYSQDDEFYRNPRLHEVIDAMIDFYYHLKNEGETSRDEIPLGDDSFSPPGFDLGVNLDSSEENFENMKKRSEMAEKGVAKVLAELKQGSEVVAEENKKVEGLLSEKKQGVEEELAVEVVDEEKQGDEEEVAVEMGVEEKKVTEDEVLEEIVLAENMGPAESNATS